MAKVLCSSVFLIVFIGLIVLSDAHPMYSQELPAPTGPYFVGTSVTHFADRRRPDVIKPSAGRFRELMVQFWYPIDRRPKDGTAGYLPNKRILTTLIDSQYNLQSEDSIKALANVKISATLDATISKRQRRYPLLIFSHGLGEPRSNYTSLAQELASQGFIVACIDHPYGGYTVLPDGRILTTADDDRGATPEGAEAVMKEWSDDALFLADSLTSSNRLSRQDRLIANAVEPSAIGMLGHSLGGAAALETCLRDARFKACADLDGAPFGEVTKTGVKTPTLVLRSGPVYSDADLAKRGRTRDQWNEMGRQGRAMWASIAPKDKRVPYFNFSILGTGHMSYSDSPFTLPDTITRFGGKITDFNLAYKIIRSYVTDFFNAELKHQKPELIDNLTPPYSDVVRF